MAAGPDQKPSHKALKYIINHVFMPPKLPQQDDTCIEMESALLKAVINSLTEFKTFVSDDKKEEVRSVLSAMKNMAYVREGCIADNSVIETNLRSMMKRLSKDVTTIPIQIRAQNAGVILSRIEDSVVWELFELSPLNESVMKCKGRLRRSFPGPAWSLTLAELEQEGMIEALAHTLAKMAHQPAPDSRPTVAKAKQQHEEIRDTIHPKVVTELFGSMLRAVGKEATVSRIWKNTREDVLWSHSLLPWRRSPSWLLIRVTMQIMFARWKAESSSETDLYKEFMAFMMARMLEAACTHEFPADLIYVMNAKVSRRVLKLDTEAVTGIQYVKLMVEKANRFVELIWDGIRSGQIRATNPALKELNFGKDALFQILTLDQLLFEKSTWKHTVSAVEFNPVQVTMDYTAEKIPHIIDKADERYSLIALETWVSSHLASWLCKHQEESETCGKLAELIKGYHKVAHRTYADDPEALSRMFLTILEVWIACDRSAIAVCGLLQEYDPGIPFEWFQCLLLPSKALMDRLFHLEVYLQKRRAQAQYGNGSIFWKFGTSDCFSVQYFATSAIHQELLARIERDAANARREKEEEFNRKKAQYSQLMSAYENKVCDYIDVDDDDIAADVESQRHSPFCQKCQYKSRADALDIELHEWPLPTAKENAMSTVFELVVPVSFGDWRDACVFVMHDVLRAPYECTQEPRCQYHLRLYDGLKQYFVGPNEVRRIGLLSQVKPHMVTHRKRKKIAHSLIGQVCLRNGLKFQYFDREVGSFTDLFSSEDKLAMRCRYQLPSKSLALQVFLDRSSACTNGPPPNRVIAQESEYPEHLSLDEYRQLASMPLGFRLPWLNILVQLSIPSIDFTKVETAYVILQVIHQAGPFMEQNVLRATHYRANDPRFAAVVIERMHEMLEKVMRNWESSQTLAILVSLALRLLSLATDEEIRNSSLLFLCRARMVASDWMNSLCDKAAVYTDEKQRAHALSKGVEAALICLDTYNVDAHILQQVFGQDNAMSVFITCCIFVQQKWGPLYEAWNRLLVRLYRGWQTLCRHAYPILLQAIIEDGSNALDAAISQSWSAYQPQQRWTSHSSEMSYWLTQHLGHASEMNSSVVQYSLLTGELLVNGLPLSRLPAHYESHSVYAMLFGKNVLDVMPSQVPGLHFSAKTPYRGHQIELGMDPTQGVLRVLATRGTHQYLLIPKDSFRGQFPTDLVDDFAHWYNVTDHCVELRPIENLWDARSTKWRLVRYASSWRLDGSAIESTVLLSIQSQTVRTIASILACLDLRDRILVTFNSTSTTLDISIPRLQLDFYVDADRGLIRSRQFRGMHVDHNQDAGTLTGLSDQLILKDEKNGRRLLIVPEGRVAYQKTTDHVLVNIDKGSMTRFHAYHIESLLGRLKDNGSLQSKLYLAYLHALTSFCLPDPLTYKSGTEQALDILSSAAVLSHDTLSSENIELLQMIAKLTPGRRFYPIHERVMQEVFWNSQLSFLAQHGHFYSRTCAILRHAQRAAIFYPTQMLQPPDIDGRERDLLARDNIRSSNFRRTGSGAEDHTHIEDTTYSPRHQGQSLRATNAFVFARIVYQNRLMLHCPPEAITQDRLWNFLSIPQEVYGSGHELPPMGINYDATYLIDSVPLLAQYWCCLHQKMSQVTSSMRVSQMVWMATLAFASDSDSFILQTLTSVMLDPQQVKIDAPTVRSFQPSKGVRIEDWGLRTLLNGALLPLHRCPENNISRSTRESKKAYIARKKRQHEASQAQAMNDFITDLKSQWICRKPNAPSNSRCQTYFDVSSAMNSAGPIFEAWFNNDVLRQYIGEVVRVLRKQPVVPVIAREIGLYVPEYDSKTACKYLALCDMLSTITAPTLTEEPPSVETVEVIDAVRDTNLRLPSLIQCMEDESSSQFEQGCVRDLKASLQYLESHNPIACKIASDTSYTTYERHLQRNQEYTDALYKSMNSAVKPDSLFAGAALLPHTSPLYFLQHLAKDSWPTVPDAWKTCIVKYGMAITRLQQAKRLLALHDAPTDLAKELSNPGHTNWHPMQYPEFLLLEIENGLIIRANQQQIAQKMRNPGVQHNAVMQLNMGEGKSSVIVPIVVATMANGTRLMRVIITKAQSKQMFRMLISKLGGLLGRQVYRMPFSRSLRFNLSQVNTVFQICQECMERGGVLLMQPEHVLSFELMVIDSLISGNEDVGQSLLTVQRYFNDRSRDVIDESDEVFSVKFELVYTMGLQQPLEMSPARWLCIQQVLDIVRLYISKIQSQFPGSIIVGNCEPNNFPRLRILRKDAWCAMARLVVEHICDTGLSGFPIARQRAGIRASLLKYIIEFNVDKSERDTVENAAVCGLWIDSFRPYLLLLRGLFAGGVLLFALSEKRWRVNYGPAFSRTPPTRLAVPYTAKDCPTPRSEFSHPDVTIVLTQLNYYYSGIEDGDLFLALDHLLKSDQADLYFQDWVQDCPGLPSAFRQICGINLKDQTQCVQEVFPFLRKSKKAIDYFLAHIIFPKEMKTFPNKLSASGWDIGRIKTQATTGFSGTNDSRKLLPLGVSYLDLPEQRHTNALVLEYLLQPKNSVAFIPPSVDLSTSGTDGLLSLVVAQDPVVRVILDVGAQVIELNNVGVAQRWLTMISDCNQTKAAIFFNEEDELCVVDRHSKVEFLQTSIFADQLDLCLVFLDEAHTRGTDLKLPPYYRAAVTLGPKLTKDKLVQACMRMRELADGQSVVFCVPTEIAEKLRNKASIIDPAAILKWTVKETTMDLERSMPLWTMQGHRFVQQESQWETLHQARGLQMQSALVAETFLEPESLTLEQRYLPLREGQSELVGRTDNDLGWIGLIAQRCEEFGRVQSNSANLQEEQERELSPEIEQERQISRPEPAEACPHDLHPDLVNFVKTGKLAYTSDAWLPAFESLKCSSAGNLLNVDGFQPSLLVTRDFAKAVEMFKSSDVSDLYQRPVQWILSKWHDNLSDHLVKELLIISPYEAQELLPDIEQSEKVTLHIYAARSSLQFRTLDELKLYTIPVRSPAPAIDPQLKVLLNLFAGQLYFQHPKEYQETCRFLGLACTKTGDECIVAADGFIMSGQNHNTSTGFQQSPIPFLNALIVKIRRNCEAVDKTHIGRVLEGELLGPNDFPETDVKYEDEIGNL